MNSLCKFVLSIFGILLICETSKGEDILDVLVLYTESVVHYHNEEDGVRAHIQASFLSANMAFSNSAVDIQLRLRELRKLDYDEDYEDMGVDLDFIASSPEVLDWRDEVGADLVCLYRGDGADGVAGVAYLLRDTAGKKEIGFCVVSSAASISSFTFQHEIGHNLGGAHDRENSDDGGLYPYSYGYRFNGSNSREYRTVMAYAPGQEINYFSNPDIQFLGFPTGVAAGSESADNARTFRSVASSVNSYYSHKHKMPIAVAGEDVGKEDTDGDGFEQVTLDASQSVFETHVQNLTWTWSGGSSTQVKLTTDFPLGDTEVFLEITDEEGYTDQDSVTVTVFEPAPLIAVEAGYRASLFMKEYGAVLGLGQGRNGELGGSNYYPVTDPIVVQSVGVKTVSMGREHTLLVKNDSSLWVFGSNEYGQLGLGDSFDSFEPRRILESGVAKVSAGANHSLILMENGSVLAMGANGYGQLGDGSTEDRRIPVEIFASGIKDVAAGDSHSLYVKTDGSLWYAGVDPFPTQNSITTPERIMDSGVVGISAFRHSLIVKDDGSLWAFGVNYDGQLGDSTREHRPEPKQIFSSGIASASAGEGFSLIVKTDDSLWMAGRIYLSPSLGIDSPTPSIILHGGVAMASAGERHGLILREDGSAWAFGNNSDRQFGGEGHIHQTFPIEIIASPIGRTNFPPTADAGPTVSRPDGDGDGYAVVSVSGGASTDDWQVVHWKWSWNGGAAFGKILTASFPVGTTDVTLTVTDDDGAMDTDSVLVVVEPQSGVVAVKAGRGHSLILKEDGSLWGAGSNSYGQLGGGGGYEVTSFTLIEATGVTDFSAGSEHSIYLKEDGSLWGMGNNRYNALGPTSLDEIPNPIKIVESGVAWIRAGYSNSFYGLTDGSVWAMGENYDGQLGDGSLQSRASPVKIFDSGVAKVVLGPNQTIFLKEDGALWVTGNHRIGGNNERSGTPLEIVASDVVDAAIDWQGFAFVKSDGSLWVAGEINLMDTYYNEDFPLMIQSEGVKAIDIAYSNQALTFENSIEIYGDQNLRSELSSSVVDLALSDRFALFVREDGSLWGLGEDVNGQFGLADRRTLYFITNLIEGDNPIEDVAPVARAGDDQSLVDVSGNSKQVAALDGSKSFDDWQVVSWDWKWINGSAEGKFAIGEFRVGETVVTLTVKDIFGQSSQDTVRIIVQPQVEVKSAAGTLLLMDDGSVYALGGQYLEESRLIQNLPNVGNSHQVTMQVTRDRCTSVAVGSNFSLFVKEDGSLWSFGENDYGQLGDGTTRSRYYPDQIIASGVASIECGESHVLVLKDDGSVWAFGKNESGQLGIGTTESRSEPTLVFSGGIRALAAGDYHSLFVKDDGSLWGCGLNETNQLGDDSGVNKVAPIFIMESGFTQVAGNGFQSIILDDRRDVWTIGSSDEQGPTLLKSLESPVTSISSSGYGHFLTLENGALWSAQSPNFYEGSYHKEKPRPIYFSNVHLYAGQGITIRSDKSVWSSWVSGPPIKVVNGIYPFQNAAPTANAGPDMVAFSRDQSGVASVTISGSRSTDDWQVFRWGWEGGRWPAYGYDDRVTFPFLPGETRITLTVYDNQNRTSTDDLVVTVLPISVLEEWLLTYFSAEEIAAWPEDLDWADPDKDGLDNTREYNLGTNPRVASDPFSDTELEYRISDGNLVFEVWPYARGLNYVLLGSEDGIDWIPVEFDSYERDGKFHVMIPKNMNRLYQLKIAE